jgi:hypothetical protein
MPLCRRLQENAKSKIMGMLVFYLIRLKRAQICSFKPNSEMRYRHKWVESVKYAKNFQKEENFCIFGICQRCGQI